MSTKSIFDCYDVDFLIIPRNCPCQVEDEDKDFFKIITGLSVSAGIVVLSRYPVEFVSNRYLGAVFLDSRYDVAAKNSLELKKFQILPLKFLEIVQWINKNKKTNINQARSDCKIGLDFSFFTKIQIEKLKKEVDNVEIINTDYNVIKVINKQKVINKKKNYIFELKKRFVGKSFEEKFEMIKFIFSADENKLDALLFTDPLSIAWLFNIRALDTKYTPVLLAHALLDKSGIAKIYINKAEYTNNFNFPKIENIAYCDIEEMEKDIVKYDKIGVDLSTLPASIDYPNFCFITDPCVYLRSLRNSREIECLKHAHITDGICMVEFFSWLYGQNGINEFQAAKKLDSIRAIQPNFISLSFSTISAAGANASMIHYNVSQETAKIIDGMYLIDSGAHYLDGTTDVTRTVALSEQKDFYKQLYTLVLKGHIALSRVQFPTGTTGNQLDVLARQFLWKYNLDYPHGTGHGVGYVSHVHDGVANFSKSSNVPIVAGMVLSNEPGVYKKNKYGIRIENMMKVVEINEEFLGFSILTMVPYDTSLIAVELLTSSEIEWIDSYHKNVYDSLFENLSENGKKWFKQHVKFFSQ